MNSIKPYIHLFVFLVFLAGCYSQELTPAVTLQPGTTPSPTDQRETETLVPTHSPTTMSTLTPTDMVVPSTATPSILKSSDTPQADTPTAEALTAPSATVEPLPGGHIVVDHTSVALFDQIPDDYITAARNLGLLFSDASVGDNIDSGLDCLAAPSWAQSSTGCRRAYTDANWNWKLFLSNSGIPQSILFTPDPVKYDRSNWTYVFRTAGDWNSATQEFIEVIAPAYLATKDVLSYQFSYYDGDEISDITHPTEGFFGDNPNRYNIHDLEAFMAQHPDKTFFLWTTSLSRRTGSDVAVDLNNQMRQYAREHNLALFDVADILSHSETGAACFDNRDGVPYCDQSGQCEDHPDDGRDIPAICRDYTTEADGGHLGSVSAGRLRIAKAFWVLMARIAGWNP